MVATQKRTSKPPVERTAFTNTKRRYKSITIKKGFDYTFYNIVLLYVGRPKINLSVDPSTAVTSHSVNLTITLITTSTAMRNKWNPPTNTSVSPITLIRRTSMT